MRAPLRLSLHIEIFITGTTRLFLRNLVNSLMIVLLGLSPLSVSYVLVVQLHILIMNVTPHVIKILIKLLKLELSHNARLNQDTKV
jgi:hypothetical protein